MPTRALVRLIGLVAAAAVLGACSATNAPPRTEPAPAGAAIPGQCPQARTTGRAPDSYYMRKNPLASTPENLERGRALYERDARPVPCASCHGIRGDGKGPEARGLVPPPRNFTCAETMNQLPDGQLYWIIETGSGPYHLPSTQGAQQIERPGRGTPFSAMGGYREFLSEPEIWQLVLYIRSLARQPGG